MNWNDYEAILETGTASAANADLAMLKQTFGTETAKTRRHPICAGYRRGLSRRGWVNRLRSDLVAPGEGGLAHCAGRFACILWVTGFFVRERFRAPAAARGSEAQMLAKLEAEIAELRHQRRLLLSLWKWYLRRALPPS